MLPEPDVRPSAAEGGPDEDEVEEDEEVPSKLGPDYIPLLGQVEITGVTFRDANEEERVVFRTGEVLTIEVSYRAHAALEDPTFGIALFTENGTQINGPNTRFAGFRIERIAGEGVVRYTIRELPLLAGRYYVTAAVTGPDLTDIHDHKHLIGSFVVQPTPGLSERWGLALIPAEWGHRSDPTGE
jgi:hypothetical protein